MVVQHNLTAMNANRQLGITTGAQAKSTEKLSSGFKINRAADDAAGLKISEKMRSQVRGLNRASTNAQDGVSAVQTAEGALTEVHSMLQRMNELAVQGSNDTNETIDRDAINQELAQLTKEIDRVAETTQFNKQNLLDGSFTNKRLQVGANTDQNIGISIDAMNADGIGLNRKTKVQYAKDTYLMNGNSYTTKASAVGCFEDRVASITGAIASTAGYKVLDGESMTAADYKTKLASIETACMKGLSSETRICDSATVCAPTVDDYEKAQATLDKIQAAINNVSNQRSALGAIQNRLEHTIANLDNVAENTDSAESRIRDTDMASEMVKYSKNNILAQAGQSMLAQANQSTQGVLSLLQ